MDPKLPRQLITSKQLKFWLNVGHQWLDDRLAKDKDFPVVNLAPEGAARRTLRFEVHAVAQYLGIPVPPRDLFETANQAAGMQQAAA